MVDIPELATISRKLACCGLSVNSIGASLACTHMMTFTSKPAAEFLLYLYLYYT